MLLAVDIGNTLIVMGIFHQSEMLGSWRIASLLQRTADECWTQVMACCSALKIDAAALTEAAISSVVPEITSAFTRMVNDHMPGVQPFIFKPHEYDGMEIIYDSPKSVGSDRICNAVAGFQRFGGPLIIVDFGTATTFDVVDEKGRYIGGIIAPGLETSAAQLHHRAAKLVKVDFKFPPKVIGDSTETSIQSGLMFGTVEMIDGLVNRIWKEIGRKCPVIATGGLAPLLSEKCAAINQVVPFLVLEGLHLIYQQVKR